MVVNVPPMRSPASAIADVEPIIGRIDAQAATLGVGVTVARHRSACVVVLGL